MKTVQDTGQNARTQRVFVAGHRGVVGSAIVRRLRTAGFTDVITRPREELDLQDARQVRGFFESSRPDVVIIAAARVGGIAANMAHPVEFLIQNLEIQNNLLMSCHYYSVAKTMFLGSSCVYPRETPQPMPETAYMTGPVEPTNKSYAIAKIAGIQLAQSLQSEYGMRVICPMPCNVYGPGDHFDLERAHVVSALVRRFVEATGSGSHNLTLWGTGSARREFLHTDDLADACVFLLDRYEEPEIINVGSGQDYSIQQLALRIAALVGYRGKIEWDTSKPDGMPQKLLDVSRLQALGWRHRISLDAGLAAVIEEFRRRGARESSPE